MRPADQGPHYESIDWKSDVCTTHNGLQSKRPQVKTSPSQNVPELVKTSPKIGQNVPMV